MDPLIVGLISVVCISIGLLVGVFLQNILPARHLDAASKDTVRIGAGMLATLTALVLGLLVSSAKSSFDAMNTAIASGGAKVVMLDRVLANYGPQANEVKRSAMIFRCCVVSFRLALLLLVGVVEVSAQSASGIDKNSAGRVCAPVPALVMKIELSSPEATLVR
jgi:hypothetical protein